MFLYKEKVGQNERYGWEIHLLALQLCTSVSLPGLAAYCICVLKRICVDKSEKCTLKFKMSLLCCITCSLEASIGIQRYHWMALEIIILPDKMFESNFSFINVAWQNCRKLWKDVTGLI